MNRNLIVHTLSVENVLGKIMFLRLSIISQLDILLPATVAGICTDIDILACGLRYKLCGKYNGTQSDTFFTVWIFIVWLIVASIKMQFGSNSILFQHKFIILLVLFQLVFSEYCNNWWIERYAYWLKTGEWLKMENQIWEMMIGKVLEFW